MVIYDSEGKIYFQASGDYELPGEGVQYLETDIDHESETIKSVDMSVEPHTAVVVPLISTYMSLEDYKKKMIDELEYNFANYLSNNPIVSSCHKGEEAEYTVTKEKQTLLMLEISLTERASALGIDYQPSWNAHDCASTDDWTLEELYQLSFDIAEFIKPLVADEQAIDFEIRNAESFDELLAIDISFE